MKRPVFEYSIGNLKVGSDTLIFNITSAAECPSRKLGLCQLADPSKCYARKAEIQYPQVLPYRKRQTKYWDKTSPALIASDIVRAIGQHKDVKYVRISEAGDMRTQKDINKLVWIADSMPGIIFYTYTARRDLDWTRRPKNLIINGSGFMIDNAFCTGTQKTGQVTCPGSCQNCKLCKTSGKRSIFNAIH